MGAGYSGTLTAVNLLEVGAGPVTLVERADRFARGAAYGTTHPEHLLNVRAGGMSAFPDRPGHFTEWRGRSDALEFAPRRDYGRYLGEILARWSGDPALTTLNAEAVAAEPAPGGWTVTLADGGTLGAGRLVLATGNMAPQPPPGVDPAALPPGVYVPDPWRASVTAGLDPASTVLIVGTGLTMVDAVVTLESSGFGGRIVALSRRGLWPRAHTDPVALDPVAGPPPGGVADWAHAVRARAARRAPWQAGVDEHRPVTAPLWAAATPEQRRRFLRHARPWWDIHRHRIAPAIAARLDTLIERGALTIAAGKLVRVEADDAGARVTWRPRGATQTRSLAVARIVNCTGPASDIARFGPPLVRSLFAAGLARPDPLRLGVDVAPDCAALAASGAPTPGLYAVGPLTKGAFWEIVAVPDIRAQVASLAGTLAGRSGRAAA